MSNTWWDGAHTTVGHGIHSQYRAEFQKEWFNKETRRHDRAQSPERFFSPNASLHNGTGLIPGEPLEHRHHAMSKHLSELKLYQTAPPSGGFTTKVPTQPEVVGQQPVKTQHLPHLCHHHHFGWVPPTPQGPYAVVDSKVNHYKMGQAQNYNHKVFSKASLITSRKA
uniref:Uncharacterized protein n=1 Tax=Chlamydomonas leiostraca TaxID=1034604 RepID=A0A7S0WWM3_9CHLO|mmetsp:Transcript_31196/g.79535  ORF Transcript_31196/g.79535 Transcript_31196/m.79535 type:complete len:167 (+) Transcript_31196:106-606(+)|eukprot:CAMPEP_0202859146 /NCGR_PEP_ID=MMETSP1391-20130828/1394_1 /ASSEMBLY_ACC=CAM_ASM_000867 /TAXON_ID=1034604 /ORGANISM="Chlamydomonas leiostraca, Strain SAG 11-49" /LENGTH=166 /DNA_ID=CAMNT_0049538157 /DNA_START=108 /DNA_END=608 /DNA_ORIENTATION=-